MAKGSKKKKNYRNTTLPLKKIQQQMNFKIKDVNSPLATTV